MAEDHDNAELRPSDVAEDHVNAELQPSEVAEDHIGAEPQPSEVAEDHVNAELQPSGSVREETVDGMAVFADLRPIEPARPAPLPAVQAAAVAATGFVAGAATMALVRRHTARKLARAQGPVRRGVEGLPGLGPGRTFLVHVHMIGRPGD